MTAAQLLALLPLLLVSATIVAVMLGIAVRRHHRLAAGISVLGFNLALLSLVLAMIDPRTPVSLAVTGLLVFDGAGRFAMLLVLATSLGVLTLCHAYFEGYRRNQEEIYLLIGLATLGGVVLVAATHVATLLLGLELLSLPMVAAVAYSTHDKRALEGGLKYLVLSAAASASLLFGFALLYAATGHLDLAGLSQVIAGVNVEQPLVLAALAMIVGAFAFKLSVVPFHQWTPDVYEAAPTPVAAYLATVSKVGVFAVVLRLFHGSPAGISPLVAEAMIWMALASMLLGSVLALRQASLKRLMAYSSIAHFGYLLLVLVVPGERSLQAAGIYLAVYLVSSLGVFGVMALMSSPMRERDVEYVHEYRGLFWRRPYLASILTAMMLSLAGVPVTAGFIGKFAVIAAGIEDSQWLLVGGIVLGSAISVYYYLRVIITLFHPLAHGGEGISESMGWAQTAGGIMLLMSMLLVLAMAVFPNPLYRMAGQFVSFPTTLSAPAATTALQ